MMFFTSYKHIKKSSYKTAKGKTIKQASAKAAYHYITRTAYFSQGKEGEHVEFVQHGNMPTWATRPEEFWKAADLYERSKGRVASTLVIALPKELSPKERTALAKDLIVMLCDQYRYPFSAAVHVHKGLIGDVDQPHLHIMHSERALDGVERDPATFFKQPQGGGCRKITADVLGYGREYVQHIRETVEEYTNEHLAMYAPTKIVTIDGHKIKVPSYVSCLSTKAYNEQNGTNLKEINMIPPEILYSSKPKDLEEAERLKAEIRKLREENTAKMYAEQFRQQVGYYPQAVLDTKKPKPKQEKSSSMDFDF
ncbi:MobA/MobL family protein [Acinetobacter lwoffii]|nr:MobA/MobL family protein [Acinetobacter lwoffii]TMS49624.1 plasmid mobilization protein [Acinetobacter lwoffii]